MSNKELIANVETYTEQERVPLLMAKLLADRLEAADKRWEGMKSLLQDPRIKEREGSLEFCAGWDVAMGWVLAHMKIYYE